MKILFSTLLISFAMLAAAQNRILLKSEKKIPDLIDTTNMYSSKYGNVARLTYDNMPCIMPYNNSVSIPNTAHGKRTPADIPNAWKWKPKQRKFEADGNTPNVFPKKYNPNNTPNLWKRDSMTLRMIPEKKH
ncbi:hypothetical protein [Niabella ginsengisoli]|uniref:Uncharacterized protein n=1 Tax=Niabella ginsengisoli TaxID=522298 RepID=A0ABS9SHF3_9BACT|nr:hypothetical protein [Niabella ginsengisoli]MCH5597589.1 hypothetical protein [Niabella ginsengisoli]